MNGFQPSTRKKRTAVSANHALVNTDTGEVQGVAEIVQVTQVDDEKFIKLYTQNLKAFFELKPTTFRMVAVLFREMQRHPNGDTVYLNVEAAKDYFESINEPPISASAFHNAINEMIEKGFIAPSVRKPMYFINPAIFFNGDRVRFVQEYRRKKVPSTTKTPAQIAQNEPHQIDLEEVIEAAKQKDA